MTASINTSDETPDPLELNYFYLILVPVASIILLIQCLCWRRSRDVEQKDSMFGVEGRHSRINNNSTVDPIIVDETDSSRGPLARQLPDLPAADTCSDLYATVDEKKESDSETYSTNYDKINHKYAKVKGEHPYDKVKKNNGETEHPYAKVSKKGSSSRKGKDNEVEHPYAKVKKPTQSTSSSKRESGNGNGEEDDEDDDHAYARVKPTNINSMNNGNSMTDPNAPSTSRQAALQQQQQQPSTSNPPAPVPPTRTRRSLQSNEPVHFSGDSQDSRGYTSISVREPMSHIAVTGGSVFTPSGVSDDSESLYAAIEESNYQMINEFPRREANSPLPPVPVPVPAPVVPLPPVPVQGSGPTPSSSSSSSRRWSKADINYSEFDVVREVSVVMETDDDNYNVIQDRGIDLDMDTDPNYQEIGQSMSTSTSTSKKHGYEKLRSTTRTHGYEVITKTASGSGSTSTATRSSSNATNLEDLYSRPKKKKAPEVNDPDPNDIYSKPLKKSDRRPSEVTEHPDQLYSKPLKKSERSSEVNAVPPVPDVHVTDHHDPDQLYSRPLRKSERQSEVMAKLGHEVTDLHDPHDSDIYSKPLKKSERQSEPSPQLNELREDMYSKPVKKSERSSEVKHPEVMGTDLPTNTKVNKDPEPDYLYSKLMKRPPDSELKMWGSEVAGTNHDVERVRDLEPKKKKKIEIINVVPTPDELYSKVKRVKRRAPQGHGQGQSDTSTPSPGPSSLENQTTPNVTDLNGHPLSQPQPQSSQSRKDTTIEYI